MDNSESMIKNAVIETLKEELDLTVTEEDFSLIQTSKLYNRTGYMISTSHEELNKYYIEISYYESSSINIHIYKKICNKTLKILGV